MRSSFTFLKNRSNRMYLGLLVFALVGLALALPWEAKAGDCGLTSPWNWPACSLAWIMGLAASVLGIFLGILGAIMNYVVALGNPADVPAVLLGWKSVRDIANLFFGLGMIVIALGSIFQLEGYGWKRALPRLVVAAILINFSYVIAGFIVDVANIFSGYFLSQFQSGQLSQSLASGLKIATAYKIGVSKSGELTTEVASFFALVPSAILLIIMSGVAIITFAAGIAFLFVRIFMIWIFIVSAPIVWIFWIFPATQTYWQRWWESFLKWVFYAPVYLFMIWLSLFIVTFGGGKPEDFAKLLATGNPGATKHLELGSQLGITKAVDPTVLLQFAFLTLMLFGALWVAQQVGMFGAQTAMKMAQGVGKGLGRISLRAGERWAARGAPLPKVSSVMKFVGLKQWGNKVAGWGEKMRASPLGRIRAFAPTLASPQVWTKFWATRRAKAESRSFPYAAGQLEDVVEALRHPIAYGKGRRTIFAQRAYDTEVDKKQGELKTTVKSEEAAVRAYRGAIAGGDKVEIESTFRHLAQFNGYNTLAAALGKDFNEKGFDEFTFRDYMKNTLAPIIGQERALTMALDISGDRAAAGNFSLVGTAFEDKDTGKRDWATNDQQIATAVRKAREMEPQDFVRRSHHDNVRGYDTEGKAKKQLSALGQAIHGGSWVDEKGVRHAVDGGAVITNAHIAQLNRAQTRYLRALNDFADDIDRLGDQGHNLITGYKDASGRTNPGVRDLYGT